MTTSLHAGYAPVGPSRQDILAAKSQLVRHRQAVSLTRTYVAHMEARLSEMCPQRVVACVVPGYVDPPERIARARADKNAGVQAIIGQFCTPEHVKAYHEGRLTPPKFVVFFHAIRDLKQRIVRSQNLMRHAETYNRHLESDLSLLDPQHVVAVRVGGYVDPPETVSRAAAAEAAGEVPAKEGT